MDTLYILWKLDPYRLCDLQILPPIPQHIFPCSQVSFKARKFLISIGSNLSIFPFVVYASGVTAKDRHQIQSHGDLPLCFLVRILQFWLLGFILSFLPNNLTWLFTLTWGTPVLTRPVLLCWPLQDLSKANLGK